MARRHRSYSLEFKRHVAQQYLAGEIPVARLARQQDIFRNLIRVWVAKYEAGQFDDKEVQGDLLAQYEARVGKEHEVVDSGGLNMGPAPFTIFTRALGADIQAMNLLPPVARSSENLFETFENALSSFERRYRASESDADQELFEG